MTPMPCVRLCARDGAPSSGFAEVRVMSCSLKACCEIRFGQEHTLSVKPLPVSRHASNKVIKPLIFKFRAGNWTRYVFLAKEAEEFVSSRWVSKLIDLYLFRKSLHAIGILVRIPNDFYPEAMVSRRRNAGR